MGDNRRVEQWVNSQGEVFYEGPLRMKDLTDGISDLRPGYSRFNNYSLPLPTEGIGVDERQSPSTANPVPGRWLMPSPHCEMIVGAKTAVPNSVYCVWSGQGEDRVLVQLFYDIDAAKMFAEEQFRASCNEPAPFPSPPPEVRWDHVDDSYWVANADWQLMGDDWAVEKRYIR